jgi:hypothetical protein
MGRAGVLGLLAGRLIGTAGRGIGYDVLGSQDVVAR